LTAENTQLKAQEAIATKELEIAVLKKQLDAANAHNARMLAATNEAQQLVRALFKVFELIDGLLTQHPEQETVVMPVLGQALAEARAGNVGASLILRMAAAIREGRLAGAARGAAARAGTGGVAVAMTTPASATTDPH